MSKELIKWGEVESVPEDRTPEMVYGKDLNGKVYRIYSYWHGLGFDGYIVNSMQVGIDNFRAGTIDLAKQALAEKVAAYYERKAKTARALLKEAQRGLGMEIAPT